MSPQALPSLRRKILRSFLAIVLLYALLGALLVSSVLISSRTSPRLLHANYDSIAAADRMEKAWNALQFPDHFEDRSPERWRRQFDEALSFTEGNVTEPGERASVEAIREAWRAAVSAAGRADPGASRRMQALLDRQSQINEQAMFALAQRNEDWGRRVFWGSIAYFAASILLSILVADQLAQRLSRPLKSIVEALHRRPAHSRRLKLPEPTSLEILILTTELARMGDRLAESDRINVAEIVAQKRKLEALFESVEDALLVLDPAGMIAHTNACLASLVGLPEEQIRGQRWSDLPTLSPNYLRLRDLLRPEMPDAQDVELDWNGHRAQFSARFRKIVSSGSPDPAGTLFLLHDITEKRQREKFRSEFVDLLSHELKTPLQSLGTASEILTMQRASLPAELQLLVDTIAEDTQRIRAVAQEFVQVTQSHSKILRLKLERVALNQVLPDWLRPFSVVARDRGVRIDFEQEGSPVIWANLDSVKFPWVVSNLVSNAVRFAPADTAVTIVLSDRNGGVEIRVLDHGPGVSESDQSRIFEPFYQSPMMTSSGARGLFGVGLTIAKEVVEAHDGRIEYHRRQPAGSEFRILLPFPNQHFEVPA